MGKAINRSSSSRLNVAIKNNVQHHVHPTPCGDAATIAKCLPHCLPACRPGVLKGAPRLDEQFEIPTPERERVSFPPALHSAGGGKAKTIDRQFPYEMKINMTFLGLCTFVQQLVSLTRSSTRLGCLGQNLIPLNRDPAPRPQPDRTPLGCDCYKMSSFIMARLNWRRLRLD